MIEKHTAAVVLAAGSGKRMNSPVRKQYLELEGKPILYYALQAFEDSDVEEVVLVVSAGEEDYCRREIVERYGLHKVKHIVSGGAERYHSVLHGLHALQNCKKVLIHDGARPFVTPKLIRRALDGVEQFGACVAGMPVKDTIKISDEYGFADCTPDRSRVWMVQTPQGFVYDRICEGYEQLLQQENIQVTDDAMVMEQMFETKVKFVEGSYYNIKITTPEDLKIAQIFVREYKNEE